MNDEATLLVQTVKFHDQVIQIPLGMYVDELAAKKGKDQFDETLRSLAEGTIIIQLPSGQRVPAMSVTQFLATLNIEGIGYTFCTGKIKHGDIIVPPTGIVLPR
jgi:hypothetical protein